MKFTTTQFADLFIIDIVPNIDNRGYFARTFCKTEFLNAGINFEVCQTNISFNAKKGTLRGMHFQEAPYEEAKIVSCISGKIFDVVIDLRKDSSTYGRWLSVELDSDNKRAVYIPKGFAHGFQTLENSTEILYLMSEYFKPGHERGIRWNDKVLSISWPLPISEISERDSNYSDYKL